MARKLILKHAQDYSEADKPSSSNQSNLNAAKSLGSSASDGKPRLLLMGQRRYKLSKARSAG